MIAGCWVRLNGYENGVQPSIDSAENGTAPASRASNAGTATAGVTSRSQSAIHRRMCAAEVAAAQHETLHVERRQRRSQLGLGGEVGIGDALLLGRQRVPQRPGPEEPEARRDVERVGETGIGPLDVGAEVGERLGGGIDGAGDLRVDVVDVAQRRRVSDTPSLDAVVETGERVDVGRRQRRPVAGSGCWSTASIRAASGTLIVCGPRWDTVPKGDSGYAGTRPKLGLSPTLPQNAAGMRTDPAPSVPTLSGARPAATAAAVPPDDPPASATGPTGCG